MNMNYYVLFSHFASILAMLSYLVKDILWLRGLAILSSIAGIFFGYCYPATPIWTIIIWNAVFVVINAVQIVIIIKERSSVEFSETEKELYDTLFRNFAPFEFMKFVRLGQWRDAKPDQILAVEGQPINDVLLIYNGLVTVESHGKRIAQLRDGSFVGEVSFLTGGTASATVRAVEPTRYLSWSKADVNNLLTRNPAMKLALQTVLSTDLSNKIRYRAPSVQLSGAKS
jgi:hypothetical protein